MKKAITLRADVSKGKGEVVHFEDVVDWDHGDDIVELVGEPENPHFVYLYTERPVTITFPDGTAIKATNYKFTPTEAGMLCAPYDPDFECKVTFDPPDEQVQLLQCVCCDELRRCMRGASNDLNLPAAEGGLCS